MTFAKNSVRCKLELEHSTVEQVMSFTYLGINVFSDRNLITEVQKQTLKAAGVFRYQTHSLENKKTKIKYKVKIHKSVYQP